MVQLDLANPCSCITDPGVIQKQLNQISYFLPIWHLHSLMENISADQKAGACAKMTDFVDLSKPTDLLIMWVSDNMVLKASITTI